MKKTINGIRYDTDKSLLVGEYHTEGLGMSDFRYWEAALYKGKRTGRFFLAGQGHAMTRFADRIGDNTGWGEKIIPMSAEEALAWAEQFIDNDDVITEHFGDLIKDA